MVQQQLADEVENHSPRKGH